MNINEVLFRLERKSEWRDFFAGYELLCEYSSRNQNANNKANDVVILVHFILNYCMDISYMGINDELAESGALQFALPENWNNDSNHYVLRYGRHNQRFLLCVNVIWPTISLSFVNVSNLQSTSIALNLDSYTDRLSCPRNVNKKAELAFRITEELLQPIGAERYAHSSYVSISRDSAYDDDEMYM